MKGSNAHTIEQRIVAWKRGRIFFPSDFADIASDGSVRITLMRLSVNSNAKFPHQNN